MHGIKLKLNTDMQKTCGMRSYVAKESRELWVFFWIIKIGVNNIGRMDGMDELGRNKNGESTWNDLIQMECIDCKQCLKERVGWKQLVLKFLAVYDEG